MKQLKNDSIRRKIIFLSVLLLTLIASFIALHAIQKLFSPSLRELLDHNQEEHNKDVHDNEKYLLLQQIDSEKTAIIQQSIPSVVSITTTTFTDPHYLIKQFFGKISPFSTKQGTLGSGIILTEDGYIITNLHVIKGASEIRIHLSDGRTFLGKIIGLDTQSDIALLKISAPHLVPIIFGNSDDVQVGQMVFAIGNPFGLQETVTEGIISAKNRKNAAGYEFFQTSATINPGNSGGPLINTQGKVIGINNFILTKSGLSEGIGFAIPSNTVRHIYEEILSKGHALHPWLGILTRAITPYLAYQLGIQDTYGLLVITTLNHSPAEKSSLLPNDFIIAFNGIPIHDLSDFIYDLSASDIGSEVKLTIIRNKKKLFITLVVEEAPIND